MGNYAIWLVLSMTLALTVFGDMTRRNLYRAQLESVQAFNANQAKNISQAVILGVSNQLNDEEDVSDVTAYTDWDAMGGSYKYTVTEIGDTILVESWGKVNNIEYRQELKLLSQNTSPIWNPNLPYAVFSGSNMSLSGSARIIGHAGTNAVGAGDVNLSWATSIDSSLSIGPGGDPSTTVIQASGHNVGLGVENLPSPGEYELPDFIDYPAKTTIRSPIVTVWPFTNITLNPSDYDGAYIPSVTVQSNYELTINTGTEDRVMHVGDFNLTQGRVNIVGSGNLTLIVEDDLVVSGSSTMNNGGTQEKLFTYYGGEDALNFAGATTFNGSVYAETADITISGSGGIQGHIISGGDNVTVSGAAVANTRVLYAPNAHVNVTGSGSIRGAIVANSFSASGAGRVEFSQALTSDLPELEVEDGGGFSGYAILSWY
ncbi:MAG: hypothetical protein JJ971_01250 [Balneolaceae bacterium]|nr:hypothetical protein [Balneolaceae bacterium]MBO6544997.1 hypothetical protein [Balneolaceae bacterium]MBO6646393.1 hypothetical protein [Balneolaceae bacterium]